MAAVVNADGGVEVAIATTSRIIHSWDGAEHWLGYKPGGHDVVTARDPSGRMMIAWLNDGKLYFAGAPGPRTSLTSPVNILNRNWKRLRVVQGKDGYPMLFGLDGSGAIWYLTVDTSKPGEWKWNTAVIGSIGGHDLKDFVLTQFGERLWAVVALGGDDKVYFLHARNVGLQPWITLDGRKLKRVYANENANHGIEIVAQGSDEKLYYRHEEIGFVDRLPWNVASPGPILTDWSKISDQKVDQSVLFRAGDGRLTIWSWKPNSGEQQLVSQSNPNSGVWVGGVPPWFSYPDVSQYLHGFASAFGTDGRQFAIEVHEEFTQTTTTVVHVPATEPACYVNGVYMGPNFLGEGSICIPGTPAHDVVKSKTEHVKVPHHVMVYTARPSQTGPLKEALSWVELPPLKDVIDQQ